MSRLETLYNRYERLIEANRNYKYIYNDKAERYLKVISLVKQQISIQQNINREKNKSFSNALKLTSGLNGFQILNLLNK